MYFIQIIYNFLKLSVPILLLALGIPISDAFLSAKFSSPVSSVYILEAEKVTAQGKGRADAQMQGQSSHRERGFNRRSQLRGGTLKDSGTSVLSQDAVAKATLFHPFCCWGGWSPGPGVLRKHNSVVMRWKPLWLWALTQLACSADPSPSPPVLLEGGLQT